MGWGEGMARILVVDDEPEVRALFCEVLRNAGHIVAEAHDGGRALEMVSSAKPDLVVLDIFMPGRDGVEVLIALRQSNPEVRIVTCSGGGQARIFDFLEMTRKLGADLALLKPILPDEFLRHIEDCLASPPDRS